MTAAINNRAVLQAITAGCDSYSSIAAATKLSAYEIKSCLRYLRDRKLIEPASRRHERIQLKASLELVKAWK